MQISGRIVLKVAPNHAISALHDRITLERFLLGASRLQEIGPAQFSFAIQRKVAVVTLNLPGTLSVTPVKEGRIYRFDAKAAHLIGGSAQLTLDITFDAIADGTNLAWDGTLDSTGLARNVLKEKEGRIGSLVRQIMEDFKDRVQKEATIAAQAAIVAKPARQG